MLKGKNGSFWAVVKNSRWPIGQIDFINTFFSTLIAVAEVTIFL
jgi:hypothetical protein